MEEAQPTEPRSFTVVIEEPPKRHVILLGAFERYNFGDLLEEKIVSKLLMTKLGYKDDEIIRAATINRDMSAYGGYDNIVSMKQAQSMSRTSPFGPFDIIYVGGETLNCKSGCAVRMLDSFEMSALGKRESIYECAYVVPKELLLPLKDDGESDGSVKNIAIGNSLGGYSRRVPPCIDAAETADYLVYRDTKPLVPDANIMVKELYGHLISSTASEVRKSLFPQGDDGNKKYIAVEFDFYFGFDNRDTLPGVLDEIAKNSHCTIVLIAAGTAPYHDNINFYEQIADEMTEPVIVSLGEDLWKTIATIAGAEAVVGTSLHVRTMGFVFHRPRVTWCEGKGGGEVEKFIGLWDAPNTRVCVDDVSNTWNVLSQYWGKTPAITQKKTKKYYEAAKAKYMESYDVWSKLLDGSNKILP